MYKVLFFYRFTSVFFPAFAYVQGSTLGTVHDTKMRIISGLKKQTVH